MRAHFERAPRYHGVIGPPGNLGHALGSKWRGEPQGVRFRLWDSVGPCAIGQWSTDRPKDEAQDDHGHDGGATADPRNGGDDGVD